ncbi:hypothetical protein [Ornithinimicrobium murale]|uniref:hypothetical protein n=1 Tax=Ornithinimicrobium murale TaxID=1050153 RepID=UPI00192D23B6|nr:hypothetical protein [Ornithinimicrobium murale]
MPIRMDHVGVVVEDLSATIAFFDELGLALEGEAAVAGEWVDQLLGLVGVRANIAMIRTLTATAGSSCRRSTGRWYPALGRRAGRGALINVDHNWTRWSRTLPHRTNTLDAMTRHVEEVIDEAWTPYGSVDVENVGLAPSTERVQPSPKGEAP